MENNVKLITDFLTPLILVIPFILMMHIVGNTKGSKSGGCPGPKTMKDRICPL